MMAAAIIGNIVLFEGVFRDYVREEQEFSAFKESSIGCIDAVEFIPAGSCEIMEFRRIRFPSQSMMRRDRLS